MERLTHIDSMGWYVDDKSVAFDEKRRGEEIDRLAAYEDIGMMPGQIAAMKNVFMGKELARITAIDGVSLARICELVQAEKEGRIAINPLDTPLTLEDLREMDGEPVWVERPGYGKRWALVQVWAKSTNIIYFAYNNGSRSQVPFELDFGTRAYHRKPEEAYL